MKLEYIIGALGFSLLCISCNTNTNKANLLDPAIKYQSDTMFSHHRGPLIKDLDTICMFRQDSLIAIYTDSFVIKRVQEINDILGRTTNVELLK